MEAPEYPISGAGAVRLVRLLGIAYVALALWWAVELLSRETPLASVAISAFLIGGPGLVLLVGGYRLSHSEIRPDWYPVVAGWCLGGIALMVGLLTLYHVQPDESLTGSAQTVFILTALSGVAGFGVGAHDARSRTRAQQVERRNRQLRRTKAELEETVAELERSNDRLEQFAYVASHDLQEPLRMISSYLGLIETRYGEDLDADAEEFLAYAVDGAERMREMIDRLLVYSRVETQGEPLEPVDLDAVFEDARTDLGVKIDETDAEISADPLPRVEGDAGQLRQVFQNLLSNAIEYSGEEPPQVRVTAARDGDEWVLSVADEGIGIDPADQERIFEVFQRLHGPGEHEGTGIGLALCERIVTRHGGDIWVDSESGEGATFSFTLPAVAE